MGKIASAKEIMSESGFSFLVKYVLSSNGISQNMKFSYPGSFDIFNVRPDTTWKKIQKESWEKECFEALNKMDLKGKIIFDIGAWHGHYILFLSKKVGIDGMIYAFEPDPTARKILISNIDKNRIINVKVLDVCVGEENGKTELRSSRFGNSQSSIINVETSGSWKKIPVDVVSIDSFCKSNSIHVDGFIIDVEGAEGMVIKGAKETIKRKDIFALIEFHGESMNQNERESCWETITIDANRVSVLDIGSTVQDWTGKKTCPENRHFHLFLNY